jgi:hypothetical protein
MPPDQDQELVLRQSPYRTMGFVVIMVIWIMACLGPNSLSLLGPEWLHLIINTIRGTLVVACGYLGIAATIQAILNIPVLQTSEEGISVRIFWGVSGRLFVRWSDIAEVVPMNWTALEIKLRDGARSMGWKGYLNSFRSRALFIRTWTTAARPEAVARTLMEIKARRSADHAG